MAQGTPGAAHGSRLLAALCFTLAALSSPSALADLASDVDTIVSTWEKTGPVFHKKPELLERGTAREILMPPALVDPRSDECLTVVILSTANNHFVARFSGLRGSGRFAHPELPKASVAGALQFGRCGAGKAGLTRVSIELRSPRGVIEVLALSSKTVRRDLYRILPNRNPGFVAQDERRNARPRLGPLEPRGKAAEDFANKQGAAHVSKKMLVSRADGTLNELIRLDPGCHRLDVLASESKAETNPVDIDLELVDVQDGERLSYDRSDNPDANCELCVGELRLAKVHMVGAQARAPVLMLHSFWPLPDGLPAEWNPQARASVAEALRRHHIRVRPRSLVYTSLGIQGSTLLPIELEPFACYVAVLGAAHGRPDTVALGVTIGLRRGQNHGGMDGSNVALSFCAGAETRGVIQVETRGGLAWLLAVWQAGRATDALLEP